MRHFLSLAATPAPDLREMLDRAHRIKELRCNLPRGQADRIQPLDGQIAALLFEKPSTRTRVSFDVGIRQLGGQSIILSQNELQLGQGESIADTARVLSRYVDLIVIRTFAEAALYEMAEFATVPVINGLTDSSHPCQILADIMTFEEHRGSVAGRAVAWLGDGNNVCNSFIEAAGQFGFELRISGPRDYRPSSDAVAFARSAGGIVRFVEDPTEAVRDADLIVTDAWTSMHDSVESKTERHKRMRPYQVNARLMMHASSDALFMHCLPAHREEEATSDVLDGPNSVIFDEAENRLHAQKAILLWCLET